MPNYDVHAKQLQKKTKFPEFGPKNANLATLV